MRDIENAGIEELAEIKLWLFQENVRIENEKQELQEKIKDFEKEKEIILKEIKEQGRRNEQEKRMLLNEKMLFENKWKILENGFRELEEDRKKLKIERERMEREKAHKTSFRLGSMQGNLVFFRGVKDTMSLKKRYKDLIKIFHPDNIAGDTETIQKINREYDALRRNFDGK